MKKLIVFCDGGLGNRLGVLIGGILTAQKLNRTPILCWPENTWCGCSFDDLFTSEYDSINLNINDLFSQNLKNKFMIHENQTTFQLEQYSPNLENIELLKNVEDDTIVYYHNSIPSYFNQEEVLIILNKFKIKQDIKNKVNDFCKHNNIDSNTLGIHFRKTDFQHFLNEEETFEYIKSNPEINYFICSDSLETEEKFVILDNVIRYSKDYYVEKLKKGLWNDLITDNEGRDFNFNINRSKESVIEGFIDLLILSKTNIIIESHSTFLKFAQLYKKIEI